MDSEKTSPDRISILPDSIIHRILSFLPSTKEAIQTSVLSKRWLKQWTHVPVLIFDFSGTSSDKPTFIDNVLMFHDCTKITKFEIKGSYDITLDPNFNGKLRYAIRKQANELILNIDPVQRFKLPNFFFKHASWTKLKLKNCELMPNARVNWPRLKDLCVESCSWPNQVIENVVSDCPLLESLDISNCKEFDRLVIASKSLKRLILEDLDQKFVLEVLCLNLVEFYALSLNVWFKFPDGAIQGVLSGCPFLELLKIDGCAKIRKLVVRSKSLKRLVLTSVETDAVVISCPKLDELKLFTMWTSRIKLMELPSSVCVTLGFDCLEEEKDEPFDENLARMMLMQLLKVKELCIGACCIQILSALEMKGLPSPAISYKCLTLDGGPNFVNHLPGIAYVLRSSPELEKLVINLQLLECCRPKNLPGLNLLEENYWNSNGFAFSCLASHLKIVQISGLSMKDKNINLVFNFVEFLLKNARVLEKMVVVLEDHVADFVFEASQKLLSFPRISQHATVELLRSKSSPKCLQLLVGVTLDHCKHHRPPLGR